MKLVLLALAAVLPALAFPSLLPAVTYRLEVSTDGFVDASFNPGFNGSVTALAADGPANTLVGGWFSQVSGQPWGYLAKINADGSLDTGFNPSPNGAVEVLYNLYGDLYVGGAFTEIGGAARGHIARFTWDGTDYTLDPLFNATTDWEVFAVAGDPFDPSRVIIGGAFRTVNGNTDGSYHNLARLNADGTLDPNFQAFVSAGGLGVLDIEVPQFAPYGILIAGEFQNVYGYTRQGIARLNEIDGRLDESFDPGLDSGPVFDIEVQSDGKILVGGLFNSVGGTARPFLARLNTDGSLDTSFAPSLNGPVETIKVQDDGKILISGGFTTVGGSEGPYIARLNSSGSVDQTFNPVADAPANDFVAHYDGTIIMGGNFTTVQGQAFDRLARLLPSGGSGMVVSSPGSVNCGVDCGHDYFSGTLVSLTAVPDPGMGVTWHRDCSGTELTCNLTMDGPKWVAAHFSRLHYQLTVSTSGSGTVTSTPAGISCGADCSEEYESSTVVALTAAADPDWHFVSWTGTGVDAGKVADPSSASTTITMEDHYGVTATFASNAVSLTVSSSAGGSVTAPGEGTFPYQYPEVVTLTATPTAGNHFVNWIGSGVTAGSVADPLAADTTITMDADHDVQAIFDTDIHLLTVVPPVNGTVTSNPPGITCGVDCEESFSYGTVVSIFAGPGTGYHFSGWTGTAVDPAGKVADPGDASTTVTIEGDYTLEAVFALDTHTLDISSSEGGSVTVPGEGDQLPYPYGTLLDITATADGGYRFVNWTGTAVTLSKVADPSAASTTVTVHGDYTLVANFELDTRDLTVTSSGGGTTIPTVGSHTYGVGETVSLQVVADTGYHFLQWTGSGVTAGKVDDALSDDTTITMDADYGVHADFAPDVHTLTVSSTTGGTVTEPGEGTFNRNYGTVVTLTALAPDAGWHFVAWTGTAVDAGKVANPALPDTTVTVHGDYAVQAVFAEDQPTTLSLVADRTQVAPDELFKVYVRVNDAVNLYGHSIDISFDASLLEAISVSEGSFLGGPGETGTWVAPGINDGTITSIDNTRTVPGVGVTGTGDLAEIRFVAKTDVSGHALVSYIQAALTDPDGQTIAVAGYGSETITVGTPAAPANGPVIFLLLDGSQ